MGSASKSSHFSNDLADINATLGSFCMVVTLKRPDFHRTRSTKLRLAHELKVQGMAALPDVPCRYLFEVQSRTSRLPKSRHPRSLIFEIASFAPRHAMVANDCSMAILQDCFCPQSN